MSDKKKKDQDQQPQDKFDETLPIPGDFDTADDPDFPISDPSIPIEPIGETLRFMKSGV